VHTLDVQEYRQDLPSLEKVVERLEIAARSALDFDFLTFSGNGEPTLYPQFAELVDEVVRIRERYRPEARIALLSNSTGLGRAEVRQAIPKIDRPVFKLDSAVEATFRQLNRPAPGVELAQILGWLSSLRDIYLQTLLVDGTPGNAREEDLLDYFEAVARIRPREVHLYSIDRAVPDPHLVRIPGERLERIARRGEVLTGVKMKAFYMRET
jgi:wyosine [tRNA(Phe)-imidazoG37] synthetase (radical SAM superfamily)